MAIKHDLTTSNGVKALMESSLDSGEWSVNCDIVKAANGGQCPSFWYAEIIQSGLARRIMAAWKIPSNPGIKISSLG